MDAKKMESILERLLGQGALLETQGLADWHAWGPLIGVINCEYSTRLWGIGAQ